MTYIYVFNPRNLHSNVHSFWNFERMCSSQSVHNVPGTFERFWRPFLVFFQVFGVSHYSMYHTNYRIGRFLYHMLIFAIHSFFMILTLRTTHHLASNSYKEIPLMSFISYISIVGDFVEHAMAHLEPLFTKKHEEEMYRLFEQINTIFATKLNHQVDFDALRKMQRKTIGFFIFSSIQAYGLSFFSLPTDGFETFIYLICRAGGVIIIRVRRCQCSIIINLMSNILMDLQILLKQLQENYNSDSDENMSENIIHLRDIYSKVWLIKNRFSSSFGWSFIAFALDYCFDFINSFYWGYITIKTYKSTIKTIRKNFISI